MFVYAWQSTHMYTLYKNVGKHLNAFHFDAAHFFFSAGTTNIRNIDRRQKRLCDNKVDEESEPWHKLCPTHPF